MFLNQSNLYLVLTLLKDNSTDADVVMSEGWDATTCPLIHPENHQHIIALLVGVVEEEVMATGDVHQVTLRWLELYLQGANAICFPYRHFFENKCLELLLCVRQECHVRDLDTTTRVRLEGIYDDCRLLAFYHLGLTKLIISLSQSLH